MMVSTKFFILVSLLYVLVQCEIPNLNVRKMDKSLIAKKRQDTLDMCRIFTKENAKKSYKPVHMTHNRRLKREVDMKYAVNPALNEEDAKRVEKIVDKLYDDMEDRGERVTYRQSTAVTTTTIPTTTENPNNVTAKASRRFFFAPKLELGPSSLMPILMRDNGTIYEKARWKHGIIPYFIDSKTYDAQLQDVIMKAFDYVEKATCIRLQKLRERPTDKRSLQEVDWVYITNPAGIRQCVHSNEKRKIDGVQMSVLGYDCMSLGDIVHEVMHILGFSHEHIRSDRDQYISIFWDNIKPGYKKYFEITKTMDQYSLENLPYDYASVLHYPPRAFSKNGQVTILTEPGIKIGQREGLSELDVEKVGTIYSSECVERNREYLLKTCPNVVKSKSHTQNVTQEEIKSYFENRVWAYGIVNYKLRDKIEFSTEERENIKAVIRHIEKETCIQFNDISALDTDSEIVGHGDSYSYFSENDNGSEDVGTYAAKPPQENEYSNPNNKLPEIVMTDPKVPENTTQEMTAEELIKHVSENEIRNVDNRDETETLRLGNIVQLTDRRRDMDTKANTSLNKVTTKRAIPLAKKTRRQWKSYPKNSRRHAESVMILTRSALPGCKCPQPGKPDGNIVVEINADCFNSVNDLLHLFVHVLGLDHQHNMHDRDAFLHIVWYNLTPDIKKELQVKLPPAASLGFPYDYQSVTHYPWLQIKDGITNMMYPIWNDGWAMGHWQGLSSFDVQKLNILYFSQCMARQKVGSGEEEFQHN